MATRSPDPSSPCSEHLGSGTPAPAPVSASLPGPMSQPDRRSQRVLMTEHTHPSDPIIDLCLASGPELPGLPPEVTAELLILYGSQDFPPSKPHLGTQAQVCDELRLWWFSC